MKLADELFLKHVITENSLLPFGFKKTNDAYSFEKSIQNDEFILQVSVKDGVLDAKLIDTAYEEEYDRINVEDEVGGFVAALREECAAILTKIRDKCSKKQYFIRPQSNRLTDYIIEKHGATPEFLWDDDPYSGVFRNAKSGKWFGIIMNVKKEKFIENADGYIEVINLKLDKNVESALKKDGVYPAYHMNKKYWVSVALTDVLTDEELFTLVDESYISSVKKQQSLGGKKL